MFDDPALNPYANIGPEWLSSPGHTWLALDAAHQSIVLLRNDKVRMCVYVWMHLSKFPSIMQSAWSFKRKSSWACRIYNEIPSISQGMLPLKKAPGLKIAAIGPNANNDVMLLGNYHGGEFALFIPTICLRNLIETYIIAFTDFLRDWMTDCPFFIKVSLRLCWLRSRYWDRMASMLHTLKVKF